MKTRIGLWIDHKKALIVFVADNNAETKLINSNLKKHHRQSGVATPADDIRLRELTEHLNNYYDEVISVIGTAEEILIIGPGEAKGELLKRLEKASVDKRLITIKTADKMTDAEIEATVLDHFNQKGQTPDLAA